MRTLAQLSALAAVLSFAVTAPVAADEATWAREANDRAEIQALMWRYERALDTLDVDAYVAVFTEDAQFGNAKGREGIRTMIAGIKTAREKNAEPGKPPVQTYQSITNMTIEFKSENRATVEGYFMAILAATPNNPPRVATVGREVDEVVKVDGRWLIAVRTVSP
jgi:3-phenylpropionate/cinnamic acid dioxygenase small subunit